MNKLYKPKVSIIIPAYNASNYLEEAIESALNQTYSNTEILVINDGSTDDGATRNIALTYKNKIKYIEKENGGSSSALNTGIKNMTGEWFSWLSHDDLYYPKKVEREINELRSLIANTDIKGISKYIISSSSELINAKNKKIRKPSNKKMNIIANRVNEITDNIYLIAEPTYFSFHGCSYLIHRTVFDEVGLFNEKLRLVNDVDMWFRIYSAGYHLIFIPEILVQGRVHSGQISKSIGFSYHNCEQDMYWQRSLSWLKNHAPNNYDVFFLFGKNAYQKTRLKEGDEAFQIAGEICPERKMLLKGTRVILKLKAQLRMTLKKLYLMFLENK